MSDEAYPLAYSTMGPDVDGNEVTVVYTFPDQRYAHRWEDAVLLIKDEAARINSQAASRPRREVVEEWRRWLHRCEEFRMHWGNEYVPSDIRAAVNMTRAGDDINLPPIDFGNLPHHHLFD